MQATVSTKDQTVQVKINNVTELTPRTAISFRNIAFGVAANATVRASNKAYRVTGTGKKARARKVD